jgi:hypothetical protein
MPTDIRVLHGRGPAAAPADVAEGAVVDVLPRLVVEEVADVAHVARHGGAARAALARHRLPGAAQHAAHLADGVAIHPVVASLVMAQPARQRRCVAVAEGDTIGTVRGEQAWRRIQYTLGEVPAPRGRPSATAVEANVDRGRCISDVNESNVDRGRSLYR